MAPYTLKGMRFVPMTIERALETYLKKGYTREWINQRLQAIQVRKELTDEWVRPSRKNGQKKQRKSGMNMQRKWLLKSRCGGQ